MKTTYLVTSLAWFALLGCKPDVGPPPSLIQGPTILAIRGEPAEVNPESKVSVSYEALAVDIDGRIAVTDSAINTSILWSACNQPKPPIENNSVSVQCLDTETLPGVAGPTPSTFVSAITKEACSLFGPSPPPSAPGEPPIRARDPDVTNGYYVPIRSSLVVPEDKRRLGMASVDSLVAFTHQRVYCSIANVDGLTYREYTANYKLNTNPKIAGLRLGVDDTTALDIPAKRIGMAPIPIPIPLGKEVAIFADWTPESRETFPAYDVIAKVLKYHPEILRISWFATDGVFKHDVTGRTEEETEFFAENTWKATTEGIVHMWIVLHDNRGGTDFESYVIKVTPLL